MKIITVVGARPQFIKAAVVSRAFASHSQIDEVIVHTGQHFDHNMSNIFFDEMAIPAPKYNLGIGGGSHAENTGRAMEALEKVIQYEAPDFVMVYGDTDSTLAGALAASKLCIPVAHVEAGLRSFNRRMPEEINRILTDHVSNVLFVPSRSALHNLECEGIQGEQVVHVGDVMYDAVKFYTLLAEKKSTILTDLDLKCDEYVLLTLHRKENTDVPDRLSSILEGIAKSDVPAIFPLHPRTRKRISEFGINLDPRIRLVDPVGYLDMQLLERNARLVATDSGGVQKEAYFHNVPCITLRDETEWTELVDIGANILVGADSGKIASAIQGGKRSIETSDIYGTGKSANAIAEYFVRLNRNV